MLICRAENPHLRAKSLEDTWKLAVQYVPIVSLKMSSSNNSNHITEGDNVYLECTARANPRPSKFFWFKQGIQLEQDTSAGVFVSEQSLVLLNVIRNGSGEYKCAAQNDEGKATSNPVNLQVRYPPACISLKNNQVFVVLEKETVELTCEVNSSPPPKHFVWWFNNSKEYMDIDPKYYKSRGSTSTFLYTPSAEEDYGVVSCLAFNTAGLQDEPCSFILAAPTLPTKLQNCSVLNRSVTTLQVECQEGFDGGITQVFHMEVLELPSMNVLSNVTSNISLLVTNLPERARAHYLLILYASNAKGRSAISTLHTVFSHIRLTESHTPRSLSPRLGFFVTIGGLLTASICAVLAAACRHRTHNNRPTNNSVDSSELDDTYTAAPMIEYSRQFALELGPRDNPDLRNGDNIEEMEMFAVSDVLRIRGNRDFNDVPSNYTISVVDCGVTARGADIAASHGPNVHESHI
ncbi:unnamed protein product [Pieris brassicae]|uniref:Ig-like domain-containing protein n=1 Tax=Pieris brassicae TaxID=7116 RepID=A0A9P0XI39_PIEBR|nr:unnamed protein product [Pieris brassicae]